MKRHRVNLSDREVKLIVEAFDANIDDYEDWLDAGNKTPAAIIFRTLYRKLHSLLETKKDNND
jgi:hypothetical protein